MDHHLPSLPRLEHVPTIDIGTRNIRGSSWACWESRGKDDWVVRTKGKVEDMQEMGDMGVETQALNTRRQRDGQQQLRHLKLCHTCYWILGRHRRLLRLAVIMILSPTPDRLLHLWPTIQTNHLTNISDPSRTTGKRNRPLHPHFYSILCPSISPFHPASSLFSAV